MTVEELSSYLQVSTRTIHELTRKKKIPHHKMPNGRRCLFSAPEIDRWLDYHADRRMPPVTERPTDEMP